MFNIKIINEIDDKIYFIIDNKDDERVFIINNIIKIGKGSSGKVYKGNIENEIIVIKYFEIENNYDDEYDILTNNNPSIEYLNFKLLDFEKKCSYSNIAQTVIATGSVIKEPDKEPKIKIQQKKAIF